MFSAILFTWFKLYIYLMRTLRLTSKIWYLESRKHSTRFYYLILRRNIIYIIRILETLVNIIHYICMFKLFLGVNKITTF